jgi:hypothetical protein
MRCSCHQRIAHNIQCAHEFTRYRKQTAFVVHFDDHLPVSSQVDQDNNTNICQPARAITQSVTNSSKVGQKMSAREHIVRNKAKRGMNGTQLSQCSQADDDNHLGPPKSLSRNCCLCRLGGHGQFQCPSLLQYGSPSEKNNGILHAQVAAELIKSTGYINTNLAPNDERIVHATLPTATKAIILHACHIKVLPLQEMDQQRTREMSWAVSLPSPS